MAQRTVIILTDDLTNEESDSVQTVTFGLDGQSYEIDLNDKNADAMREAFAKYVESGRKLNRASVTQINAKRGQATGRSTDSREESKAIREWGVENGIMKSDSRGRIPATIVDAYHNRNNAQGAEMLAVLKGQTPGQVTIPETIGEAAETTAEAPKAAPKGRGKAKAQEDAEKVAADA